MNRRRRDISPAWPLLVLLSACVDDAPVTTTDVSGATTSSWVDGLEDVDCRSLLVDAGLSDADYWKACGRLDLQEGGQERADELYRRSMWNLFRYFMTPPYAWRSVATARDLPPPERALEPQVAADAADCAAVDPEQLERFAHAPWRNHDWVLEVDRSVSSLPAPPTQPIWDQNGHLLAYEVFILNRVEFSEHLATVAGQVNALCDGLTRSTNWGTLYRGTKRSFLAATQLKLAWRFIAGDDDCRAYEFITRSGAPCGQGEYGLVAMHIVIKSNTQADAWLWGTFSHENNVDDHDGRAPLFRDPACADCQPNVCPPKEHGIRKTQVARIHAVPEEVGRTKQVGQSLGLIRGSLARYDLLGVQRLPAVSEPGTALSLPRPLVLANEIIEWDRQDSSCIACHARARVAVVPNLAQLCQQSCGDDGCLYCITELDTPGVCDMSQGTCDCIGVQRASPYHALKGNKPYSAADMTWIYDHVWNEEEGRQ